MRSDQEIMVISGFRTISDINSLSMLRRKNWIILDILKRRLGLLVTPLMRLSVILKGGWLAGVCRIYLVRF